jgi:TFIIF-interacting CTD phosphatase-like protein
MNEGIFERKLLILDIDETLLYATEEPLDIQEDFKVGEYYVYLRPYLKRFLDYCARNFEIAVWTSSTESYAEAICRQLFPEPSPIAFLWARKRCTRCVDYEIGEQYWVKDLKKVRRKGYALEQIIVVDDTARKFKRNYGNLICIREFLGNQNDKELLLLESYLELLHHEPDIRKIEKRSWRAKVNLQNESLS